MAADDRPIIIIKRRSREHAAHHGGAWKVAFADFMTAMMAFFLVMWILGLSSDKRKAIAAYFNDPTGFMKSVGGGMSPMMAGRQTMNGPPSIMPGNSTPVENHGDAERLKLAKVALEKMLSSRPEFNALRKHIEMAMTDEGLRIELLEDGKNPLFFQTGSAQLEPSTDHLLALIGRELRGLPNNILIEGHTDARPYAGGQRGYSNWELSSDRANAARRVLQPVVRERQISEVRGLADRSLRVPGDPLHYSNRRVTILVRKQKAGISNFIEHDPAKPGKIDLVAPPKDADQP
jgi:chemotaxis protein MotB